METDLVVKQVRKKPEVSRLDPIKSIFYWGKIVRKGIYY